MKVNRLAQMIALRTYNTRYYNNHKGTDRINDVDDLNEFENEALEKQNKVENDAKININIILAE